MSHHDVNRRTITKGLAWAVPAVSAAAALPAYAVSCPGTAAAEIDSWFAAYQSSLPDLTGAVPPRSWRACGYAASGTGVAVVCS
ncbi:hypothetical protein [Cutibacterium avidum]|uniref:hypothetical protein n=1 Tax=Cutibacterium avidum TaxID=33010 RepID=UPI003366D68E